MGFSLAVRQDLIDHLFGKSTYTAPAALYLGLYDTGGSEPSGGNYARVTTAPADWNAADGSGVITNAVKFTMNQPTGSWGTIEGFKLYDALSGGNEIGSGELPETVTVSAVTPAPEFAIDSIRAYLT